MAGEKSNAEEEADESDASQGDPLATGAESTDGDPPDESTDDGANESSTNGDEDDAATEDEAPDESDTVDEEQSTDTQDSTGNRSAGSRVPDDVPTEELAEEYEKLETWETELEKRDRRLEQRELGLDQRADDLDERESKLNERAGELDERRDRIGNLRDELKAREQELDEREESLDNREEQISQQEQELQEYTEELKEKEETLREYVTEEVHELEDDMVANVQGAVANEMKEFRTQGGRFGLVGGVILGVLGIGLLAAGITYAVATAGSVPGLDPFLDTTGGNYAVGALLIVIGLALNMGAVADRI